MAEMFLHAFFAAKEMPGKLINRSRTERGASMVEYALLVGLIAVFAILAVTFLGHGIANLFNSAGNTVNNAG